MQRLPEHSIKQYRINFIGLITGQTAAEIISSRANSELPYMGLTTWKKSPEGKVIKTDVSVAKNYLNEKEIRELNRVVTMYLDYAENQAERNIPMKMKEWVEKLDSFLQFNDYSVLKNAGTISAGIAKKLAEQQYVKFRIEQDRHFESDFDREIKKIKNGLGYFYLKENSDYVRLAENV